jgi:hypothetical protein
MVVSEKESRMNVVHQSDEFFEFLLTGASRRLAWLAL